MLCERIHLHERTKAGNKASRFVKSCNPRRICQKRLVDPQYEEDPRWVNVLERFRCNELASARRIKNQALEDKYKKEEDLFLSVQTLQFKGAEQLGNRPRTSFKYKTVPDGNMHRMFVKQVVTNEDQSDEDRSSQLTCYHNDDYVKYLSSTDRSRPSSGKSSSIFLQGLTSTFKANKAVQVDSPKTDNVKKTRITEIKKKVKNDVDINSSMEGIAKDTTVCYQNSGKRKSLTISLTPSPETVQVILVDVVNNCPTGAAPDHHEDSDTNKLDTETPNINKEKENMNKSQSANRYHLTNTIKLLDKKEAGGAKVTLLCNTFRLTDRSKIMFNRKPLDVAKITSNHKLNKLN